MADAGSAGDPHRRRPRVSSARRPDGRSVGAGRPGERQTRPGRESASGEGAVGGPSGPTPADAGDPGPGTGTGTGDPGPSDPGAGDPGAGSAAHAVRAFLRANPQVAVLLVVCLVLGIGTFVAVLIALATAGSDQTTGEPSGAILGAHAALLARSLVL